MEHAATTTPNRDFVEQLIDKLHQLAEEDRLEDASVFIVNSEFLKKKRILVEG